MPNVDSPVLLIPVPSLHIHVLLQMLALIEETDEGDPRSGSVHADKLLIDLLDPLLFLFLLLLPVH